MEETISSPTSSILEEWTDFCDSFTHLSSQNKRRIDFFVSFVNECRSSGIDLIPLKGIELLMRAYPHCGMRPMVDMDLLIQKKDVPKIMELLQNRGFYRKPDEGLTYIRPKDILDLDIIWDIWYLSGTSALWQRTVKRTVNGVEIKCLHPEDSLIYLVTYAVAHRGQLTSAFIKDLEYFLKSEGHLIDWKNTLNTIKSLGCQAAFYQGLWHARAQGVSAIPCDILSTLAPRSLGEKMLVSYYAKTVTGKGVEKVSYLFTWFSYRGLRGKWKLLRQVLFPSRFQFEIQRGKKSAAAYFFFLLLHPLFILIKGVVVFLRDFHSLLKGKQIYSRP